MSVPTSAFETIVNNVDGFLWGGRWDGAQLLPLAPLAILLLGMGLFMMARLGGYPLLNLGSAFAGLFKKDKTASDKDGEISPFAALSTALSGQVGTGNLAGVATAITIGGPGALFWMWITALFGMALAFAEGALAIRYREQRKDGHYQGGPMYYIRHGLGPNWRWLAVVFCGATVLCSAATGNMVQSNSLADAAVGLTGGFFGAGPAVADVTGLSDHQGGELIAGLLLAAVVFIVIIGGIRSIGSVAEKVVPSMALAYIVMAVIAVAMNAPAVPGAIQTIFSSAFTGHAAVGGFVGSSMIAAFGIGVSRGLFSNEAGQGSTPMAHAVARTQDPARQGRFAMMGTFIDTLVICTMTGLVILSVQGAFPGAVEGIGDQSRAWLTGESGFAVTANAYGTAFPTLIAGVPLGQWVASLALILFVFTTILTWSYYGERAGSYLFGQGFVLPWRLLWVALVVVGSFQDLALVWAFGSIANGVMAFPNLIAIAMLSGVVVALARGDRRAGPDHP